MFDFGSFDDSSDELRGLAILRLSFAGEEESLCIGSCPKAVTANLRLLKLWHFNKII